MTNQFTPGPERRGLPRWGRVLLIILAVLIVGVGVCTAIVASSLSGI